MTERMVLVSLFLGLGCSCGSTPTQGAQVQRSADNVPTSAPPPAQSPDRIDRVVAMLADTHGLFVNGTSPLLDSVPPNAPSEVLLTAFFTAVSFDDGPVQRWRRTMERDVVVSPGDQTYRAFEVETDQGIMVVVARHESGWWWIRSYPSP